jgi:tetratricopeptide (TPR) repeat protein
MRSFRSLGLLAACVIPLLTATVAYAQTAAEPAKPNAGFTAPASDDLARIRKLASTGLSEEALKQLDALAATQPEMPGLEDVRGLALYNLGRFAEAHSAYQKALARDSKDAEAAQMDGLTLFRLGRPADAIPLLEAAGTKAQQKADPSYVLAMCYTQTRRYDDARHAYARQYGFAQDSAPAYLLSARMLLRGEYLPIAQQFANEALKLDPKLPLAHEVLGEIALALNHTDEAIAQFEQEHMTNPLEPAPYERLGDVYGRTGRYADARASLQRAVLLEPNATGPYILLGKTTLKEGDAVSALTYLQHAEAMDPANYITHNLLAQTYRVLGRSADATRELGLTEKLQADDSPKSAASQ